MESDFDEIEDEYGQIIETRTFTDFDLVGTAFLPRRVVFSRPLDNQHFSLYHRRLTINPVELDLSFRTSSDAKRILFP